MMRFFWPFVVLLASASSCKSESDDAGTTTTVDQDPKRVALSSIASLGADIYNANFVGTPCGKVDKTTTCPDGGDIVVSGSFTCETGSNNVQSLKLDFTYVMKDCVEIKNGITLTLTGSMTHSGTSTNISSVITSETISYKSVDDIKITAKGTNYTTLDDKCSFSVTSRKADVNSDSKVTGSLCGDSFSAR